MLAANNNKRYKLQLRALVHRWMPSVNRYVRRARAVREKGGTDSGSAVEASCAKETSVGGDSIRGRLCFDRDVLDAREACRGLLGDTSANLVCTSWA